jgi:hypothetical protein
MHPERPLRLWPRGFFLSGGLGHGLEKFESFRMGVLGTEEWSGRCTLTLKPSALAVEGFLLGFGGLKTRQKIAIENLRIEALGTEEWSGRCTLTLKPSALAAGGFLLSDRAHGGLPAQFPR